MQENEKERGGLLERRKRKPLRSRAFRKPRGFFPEIGLGKEVRQEGEKNVARRLESRLEREAMVAET